MQEQKMNNSPLYLAIQTTYDSVELGFFSGLVLQDSIILDKKQTNKNFIPDLNTLLRNNTIKLEDIDFFAVNQGPGPFTSLRVIITTANGLSFATKKPLIGINGLEEFLKEYQSSQWSHTVALLNAYHSDVYYGFEVDGVCTETGAKNIDVLLEELSTIETPFRIIGNGIDLYKKQILQKLGDKAFLQDPIPQHVSIQQIGKAAFFRWQKQEDLKQQLLPLYLKTQQYQKSM